LVNKADGTVKYFNSVYCNNCLYSSEICPKSIQRHCQHEKFVTTFWMFGKNAGKFQYSVWIDIGLLTINSYRVSSVNILDIIVFAIVCIVVVVSICERLCVVLLVTLLCTMSRSRFQFPTEQRHVGGAYAIASHDTMKSYLLIKSIL